MQLCCYSGSLYLCSNFVAFGVLPLDGLLMQLCCYSGSLYLCSNFVAFGVLLLDGLFSAVSGMLLTS
ncbi:hypothetical protein RHGRI_000095 [Rhododendron griersonianum]|uniref:Uncharacterized protein n=1 Tax=Rhododendron griersonianum TaxID=479676 RepID=A0AAV6LFN0_9ERIC|nr:hypothetical protein RHGRI_000095 [Rhododendron griersonianum]